MIYEVGVRPFTAAGGGETAAEALRGTFAGLAAKAPYLASLGVTAVELLPIFEYDELEFRCGKKRSLCFSYINGKERERGRERKLTFFCSPSFEQLRQQKTI